MIKQFFILLSFLFYCNEAQAQCPEGDVELQSQSDIERFLEDYPDCTVIDGDLSIDGENNSITDLNGLNSINEIRGKLTIENTGSLESLSGIHNITSVNDIIIRRNDALVNLIGFPNLDSLKSQLYIGNNDALMDLNGLQNLTYVDRFDVRSNPQLTSMKHLENLINVDLLQIWGNEMLQNLEGLYNLNSVNSLAVASNHNLLNLKGMPNLNSVWDISIDNNDNLLDLTGLENLNSTSYLFLSTNDKLQNLNGIQNLVEISYRLSIRNNPSLINIDDLENLRSVGPDTLYIINNENLSSCSINAVCNKLKEGYRYRINGNANGCSSYSEILDNCPNTSKIESNIFYDLNQNKIRESKEPLMAFGSVTILPNRLEIFPDPVNGVGQKYLDPGEYTFIFDQSALPNWNLTTDTTQFTLTLTEEKYETIEFGIYPKEEISQMQTLINSPNNRCNDTIQFDISTHNTGSTFSNGLLWFNSDLLVSAYQYIDLPDTTIQPNKYGWFFEDLAPGRRISKSINLVIPGPPNFEIGDSLRYTTFSEYDDINGAHLTSIFEYKAEIRCSYDPNDKLVNPQRLCNYTLFEDTLIYTIRFQNTGNDYAAHVVVRDTLDANLNLNTFTLLGSSHPTVLSTSLTEENRLATFEFKGINLSDSISNVKDSQGYISYMILPVNNLSENTAIKNAAGIYFDLNPPILTNKVQNILVNEIPNTTWCRDADNDGLGNAVDVLESCEQPEGYVADCSDPDDLVNIIDHQLSTNISIYPNPSSGNLQVVVDDVSFKFANFSIYNSAGKQIMPATPLTQNRQTFNFTHLGNGIYYVHIQLDNGMFLQKKWIVLK